MIQPQENSAPLMASLVLLGLGAALLALPICLLSGLGLLPSLLFALMMSWLVIGLGAWRHARPTPPQGPAVIPSQINTDR